MDVEHIAALALSAFCALVVVVSLSTGKTLSMQLGAFWVDPVWHRTGQPKRFWFAIICWIVLAVGIPAELFAEALGLG